jgi:hypothetical protein
MIWLVAALTVVVAIMTLFLLGLLRSLAEIQQRLAEREERGDPAPSPFSTTLPDGVVPAPERVEEATLTAIDGLDPHLEPSRTAVADVPHPYLLVAFLGTTCFTCLDIWRDMIEAGDDARTVAAGDDVASVMIVLKGREHENLGKARALAAETAVPVVFSTQAWTDLEVPGSPYFTLIATADARVVGAGSAQTWEQLRSLAGDGMLELSIAAGSARNGGSGRGYRSIIESEDAELKRGGIYPGHPSLTAPLTSEELDGAREVAIHEPRNEA